MPSSNNYVTHKSQISNRAFPGSIALAIMPVFAFFYIVLILPFLPHEGDRPENILFWPSVFAITFGLILVNHSQVDKKFFQSVPILSLIVYFLFSAASVFWAYSPEVSFSRLAVFAMSTAVVAAPFSLPIPTKYTIASLHICCFLALGINAIYVLTVPPTPIGHPGYFTHKQELGLFAAVGIVLSCHELLFRGWRRILALIAICFGFWMVVASESKSGLAFALISIVFSAVMILVCKKTRLTPAHIIGAIVVASLLVHSPIERVSYRLYGDSTLTGRTAIWQFINYQISRKVWFGWGFHSYYFVPHSPMNDAPGYVRDMPSSHSGYLELKLETGRIGYWIFLVFIYSSLQYVARVSRIDPIKAWCFLSIQLFALMINLTDSMWLTLSPLWILYLIVVADSVRYSLPTRSLKRVKTYSFAHVHAVRD